MVTNENFGDFVGQPRIKKIKEGLKKCGLKAEDINFAVEVAFWIEILDSLVFADTLPDSVLPLAELSGCNCVSSSS